MKMWQKVEEIFVKTLVFCRANDYFQLYLGTETVQMPRKQVRYKKMFQLNSRKIELKSKKQNRKRQKKVIKNL